MIKGFGVSGNTNRDPTGLVSSGVSGAKVSEPSGLIQRNHNKEP